MPGYNFGEPRKVYCVEKNEIYPSINFVKERIHSNIWKGIKEEKKLDGLTYRFATPEDELNGTVMSASDYPIKRKVKHKPKKEEPAPVKRGWTNEELNNLSKAKQIADSMTNYLNQLEQIFTSPMSDNEKIESFNVAALYVGKLMVSFCDFCDTQEIYVERGSRGGKIRNKKEVVNKEDDYEYVEA